MRDEYYYGIFRSKHNMGAGWRRAGLFMQAGFAMVETGFHELQNAGNIIMKKPDGLLYRNRSSGWSASV